MVSEQSNLESINVSLEELCLAYPHDLKHFLENGFRPRTDLAPVKLEIPIDWSIDPFNDRNWCFQLHAWRMNAPILREYDRVHSAELMDRAIKHAIDWYDFHKSGETAFSWMDMATGLRAMQLAYFETQFRKNLYRPSRADRGALTRLAEWHFEHLSDEERLSLNNHGVFQAYGLKLLSQAFGKDSSTADSFLRITFDTQYTPEGLHKENSPGYHFFMTKRFRTLSSHGRLPDDVQRVIDRAEVLKPALVAPSGDLVRFGDTDGRASKMVRASTGLSITDLSKSGYVAARQKDHGIFITGTAFTYTHKHADELSFELYHRNVPVFIDAGKYAYKEDKWRRYIMSIDAHNTVGLRRGSVSRKALPLTGSLLEKPRLRDEEVVVNGSLARAGLYSHHRRFTYIPGRSLIIRDRLSSDERRQYTSTLLLAPGLEPEQIDGGFQLLLPTGERMIAKSNGAVEFFYGSEKPLLGWYSPSYGEIKPTWVVRSWKTGCDANLRWAIEWLTA